MWTNLSAKCTELLNSSFDSDILTLDYHVRGFTRDVSGKKIYIDHRINSIQNYISAKLATCTT